MVNLILPVEDVLLPQVKDLKYLYVLFKTEWSFRWIGYFAWVQL